MSWGVSKNSIFDSFPSPAPKLALVPGSRQYYDIDVQYIQVCGKSHQDRKRMRWVVRAPNVMGGVKKFHFRQFSVSCSQTSSCARKPLVLRHRCIVYTSMWQVSSGLKEDEMGSQGPQCHGGCQKFHFREFSVSCSQTSSCARKPLVLRHRCIVYTSMWQVSLGLKEDEMGRQTPHYVRGGVKKFHFRYFSVSCSQTSSCARKPLILQ